MRLHRLLLRVRTCPDCGANRDAFHGEKQIRNSTSEIRNLSGFRFQPSGFLILFWSTVYGLLSTVYTSAADRTTHTIPALTNDVTLTVTWQPQYYIDATSSTYGVVTGADWYDENGTVTLHAVADPYYQLDHWSGDTALATTNGDTLTFPADEPRSLSATFAPQRTTRGTPLYWLAQHDITNDFETADAADPDADGYPTWQEYIADTDPTNAASHFPPLTAHLDENTATLTLNPTSTNRTYAIDHTPTLTPATWQPLTNAPGTGTNWTTPLPPTNPATFYRARIAGTGDIHVAP